MTALDEIRRRRLQELQQQQNQSLSEEAHIAQQVQALENIVKPLMTKEALERYGNLKAAHPEKAVQLLVVFGQAAQSGQISKIDDIQLKTILMRLQSVKRDIKIQRK